MKITLKFALIIIFLSSLNVLNAQEEPSFKMGFSSAGLSMGWYNPSLDYWKDDSLFMNASYNGAFNVKAFTDISLTKTLAVQVGIGYWQQTLEQDINGFGNTKMQIIGYPISAALHYSILPFKFSVVTPYVGLGGEFLILQNSMKFEQKNDPDPENGATALANGIIGLDAQLSDQFVVGLEFQYKFGKYTQDFKTEKFNPDDPENPEVSFVSEDISLNGPRIGITFRYLF